MVNANIREIFLSIQGEGPHIGEEQLFIRFCGCNLHCAYCDTDFELSKSKVYSPKELIDEVSAILGKNGTISLTGGEPLLSVEFLKEFLPSIKAEEHRVYLETNATLAQELKEIINYVDIVSADIKLESATKQVVDFDLLDKFFSVAQSKELFVKIVFNEKITDEEIFNSIELAKKYNVEIILQPEMQGNLFAAPVEVNEKVFRKFVSSYPKVRLIPQMHKFLNVR